MVKVHIGHNDAVIDAVAEVYKLNPSGWLGPLYIGVCLDFLFVGILFCQAQFYYSKFQKDSAWIKYLVGAVLLFSILKTITDFVVVWERTIIGFGIWRNTVKMTWAMNLVTPGSVLISSTAQTFFVWRAFTLTGRNWYLLVLLVLLMLAVAGLGLAAGICLAIDPYYAPQAIAIQVPLFIISTLVDLIITAVISYKLVRSRRGFNRRTDRALGQLLAITWECAAPPALCQLINLILFGSMARITLNLALWPAVVVLLTPRLYACSLLYSLNARVGVNTTLSQGSSGWHNGTQPSETNQQSRKGSSGGGTMALSTFNKDQAALGSTGPIPVHVKTETLVHTSPTDGYRSGRGKSWSAPNHGMDISAVELASKSKEEDIESVGSSLAGR